LEARRVKPGVILEIAGRRSTFLPEVWEQFSTAGEFLDALCRKQGRTKDDWRTQTPARLLIYETQYQ
ncbi:MAG: AMMECR1 domain-containing protein, partial [Puniceicoccales bacterium]|nr:AMMECR1 domain-containing protein [Puniceicoccales bacterium]